MEKLNDIRIRIQEEESIISQSKERLKELDEARAEARNESRQRLIKNIQGYKEGYSAGTNEMKLRLRLIQGSIISYANKYMPYSEAGKRSITSLLTAIKNANTPATIEDAFEKIDELICCKNDNTDIQNPIEQNIETKKSYTIMKKQEFTSTFWICASIIFVGLLFCCTYYIVNKDNGRYQLDGGYLIDKKEGTGKPIKIEGIE